MSLARQVSRRLVPVSVRSAMFLLPLLSWPLIPTLTLVGVAALRPLVDDGAFVAVIWTWYGALTAYVFAIGWVVAGPVSGLSLRLLAGVAWWIVSPFTAVLLFDAWPALAARRVALLAQYPGHGQCVGNFLLEPYMVVGWLPFFAGFSLRLIKADRDRRGASESGH
jgi:hypothetical protein